MRTRTIGRHVFVVAASAALAAASLFATPALAATQQDPPGWHDPGGNAWVGFTISPNPPQAVGRTGYEPVTVTRSSSLSGTALRDAFDNWEALNLDTNDPAIDTWRWPTTIEHPGGAQLSRVDACDYTETTCRYAVVSAGDFWLFGGTPPVDINGNPDPNPGDFDEGSIALPPLPQIVLGTLNAVGTAGVGGAAGTIHLTAAGTDDELNDDPLTYEWVLIGPRSKIYTSTGTADFFDVTAELDGVYCVELTVTAADGAKAETPKCSAGGSTFSITGVAPDKTHEPTPTPGGGGGTGGGSTGGGGTGGGGGIPGIGFSNPGARAPSSLAGGGTPGASPTVIWLWRPEWFQDTPSTDELPRTGAQPNVTGRADIVVRRPSPKGASAGPWLAAVGTFGLMGGGWMLSRRRRLRMLAEL
jgi:hypothetical protein